MDSVRNQNNSAKKYILGLFQSSKFYFQPVQNLTMEKAVIAPASRVKRKHAILNSMFNPMTPCLGKQSNSSISVKLIYSVFLIVFFSVAKFLVCVAHVKMAQLPIVLMKVA